MGFLTITSIRFLIFSLNLVFVTFGLLAIVYGSMIINETKSIGDGLISIHAGAPLAAVVVGAIVTIISSIGCLGALRESNCLLLFYSAIVFLLLIVELTIGGFLYSHRSNLENYTSHVIKMAINRASNDTRLFHDLNDLQSSLKCCGAWDYHEWTELNQTLPQSCCPPAEISDKTASCTDDNVFHDGCATALLRKFGPYFMILANVSMTLAAVQLMAFVLACLLVGYNKNSYEYMIS